jgi:cytochrome b561
MRNTPTRYGWMTKALHWIVFALIFNQFVVAIAMMNTPQGATTGGFSSGTLYNWHKSIGLAILALAFVRYVWRRRTPLPDWAPNLGETEKRWIHRIENTLYLCLFVVPISGYLFVMWGGFGVNLFGLWELPRIPGKHSALASVAEWTHWGGTALLLAALLAHWTLVIRHHRRHRDRYLHRMLPFTHQK